MHHFRTKLFIVFSLLSLSACSVFGDVSVKIAPFKILEADGNFELRDYELMVLATTDMPDGMESTSSPFYKLFNYISGKNDKTEKIEMTAPVFMDQAKWKTKAMSFVLPENTSLATAPRPLDNAVKLTELRNYMVAVVTFSGRLNQKNISKHKILLQDWISNKGLKVTGNAKAAGYNPPFTLPFLRRNEIMIPVTKI